MTRTPRTLDNIVRRLEDLQAEQRRLEIQHAVVFVQLKDFIQEARAAGLEDTELLQENPGPARSATADPEEESIPELEARQVGDGTPESIPRPQGRSFFQFGGDAVNRPRILLDSSISTQDIANSYLSAPSVAAPAPSRPLSDSDSDSSLFVPRRSVTTRSRNNSSANTNQIPARRPSLSPAILPARLSAAASEYLPSGHVLFTCSSPRGISVGDRIFISNSISQRSGSSRAHELRDRFATVSRVNNLTRRVVFETDSGFSSNRKLKHIKLVVDTSH